MKPGALPTELAYLWGDIMLLSCLGCKNRIKGGVGLILLTNSKGYFGYESFQINMPALPWLNQRC